MDLKVVLACHAVDTRAATQFCAGTAQHGADAVLRHPYGAADLLVRFAFQVIHSHYGGFGPVQLAEQSANFFAIADSFFWLKLVSFGSRDHVAEWHRGMTIDELADHHAAGNHR